MRNMRSFGKNRWLEAFQLHAYKCQAVLIQVLLSEVEI